MLSGLQLTFHEAEAQLTIPGTKFTFRLNGDDWHYLQTYALPEGGDVYLYCYTGQVMLTAGGDTALPFLRVYVNRDCDGDLYELAYERYVQQPFQSLHEFSSGDGIPAGGGIGYVGAYTNPSDGRDYQFYMTYFKDRKSCVEFRLETTRDTFEEMDFEFKDILGSVK